uniref:Uncharacterized protein n=1 Tax=viral metagenome TaxID=1070528 RepID=A0A6C0DUD7_9ZZZZ
MNDNVNANANLKLNNFQFQVFTQYINSYQPYKQNEKERFRKYYRREYYGVPKINCRNYILPPIRKPNYGPNLPIFFHTYPTMYKKYIELFHIYQSLCSQFSDDGELMYYHFNTEERPLLSIFPLCHYYLIQRNHMRDTVFVELMSVVWHPDNIPKFNDWGMDIDYDHYE